MMAQNVVETLLQQSQRILHQNQQPINNISCQSYTNENIHYYLIHFQQISSTMLLSQHFSRQLLPLNRVIVFVSESQTAGRGQRTNQWMSPKGNIYLTILSKCSIQKLSLACFITAICICREIGVRYEVDVGIKWVNDLLVDGQKLGGILIKSEIIGETGYIQIGIGLNINQNPSNKYPSTKLQTHTKQQIQPSELSKRVIFSIGEQLLVKDSQAEWKKSIIQQYEERLIYRGQKVQIFDANLENILIRGIFRGINMHGFAVLVDSQGVERVVTDGRMRLESQ